MKASMVEAKKASESSWTGIGPKRGKSKSHTKTKPLKVGDSRMNRPKDESENLKWKSQMWKTHKWKHLRKK